MTRQKWCIVQQKTLNLTAKYILTAILYINTAATKLRLAKGMEAYYDAGFILIEQLKEEEINIPVIICSSRNYNAPEILGTVW
ncbi:MAG: hypothetical protein IKB01_10095 [Lachnospiraceae bacterium]|nr:hypothetical protein [Lachnospiraceae bacterium]